MKKPEIVLGWLNDPDLRFAPIIRRIIDGLKRNEAFPDPVPSIESLETAYDVYLPFVVGKDKVSGANAVMRQEKRTVVEDIVRELGPWVQLKSGGNLVKLTSTNFPLADEPGTAPTPETPSEIVLYIAGDPVSLFVKCKAQTNAKIYSVQVSRDNQNWEWTDSDTSSTVEIAGLPIGVTLYLQMRMKNVNGPSNWSSSIKFRIPEPDEVVPQRRKLRKNPE